MKVHPYPNRGYPCPNEEHPYPKKGYPCPNRGHPSPKKGEPSPKQGRPCPAGKSEKDHSRRCGARFFRKGTPPPPGSAEFPSGARKSGKGSLPPARSTNFPKRIAPAARERGIPVGGA